MIGQPGFGLPGNRGPPGNPGGTGVGGWTGATGVMGDTGATGEPGRGSPGLYCNYCSIMRSVLDNKKLTLW